MKRNIVSALVALALCGTLAGVTAPCVVQAETCSCGTELDYIGTAEFYDYMNPYDHSHWGYEIYTCSKCNEEIHLNHFSGIESHDMSWNDDMTALECPCGLVEEW